MSANAIATRHFHLGDVLTVTTGRLLSPRHIEGLYDILNYLHSDNLFTHQLPRASDDAKPFLFEQHPHLKSVDDSGVTSDNWRDWLAEQVANFGETLPVSPIPRAAELHRDPMAELLEMVGDKPIIVAGAE